MRVLRDISYDDRYDICKLDVYLPDEQTHETIVYYHGGGLESGDKRGENYEDIARAFVEEGYGFVSVGYRMYPNYRFPDFLLDGANAVRYVKDNYDDGHGIMISGQSAGAWMSLMLCMDKRYLEGVGISPLEIRGWLIDSAQTTSHFNVIKYELGLHPLSQRIDEHAPLYYVSEDTKFSKILLIFYTNDMANRYEQNKLLYASILSFNKDADISYVVLEGGHCAGSCKVDEDGQYPFVKECLKWLDR